MYARNVAPTSQTTTRWGPCSIDHCCPVGDVVVDVVGDVVDEAAEVLDVGELMTSALNHSSTRPARERGWEERCDVSVGAGAACRVRAT